MYLGVVRVIIVNLLRIGNKQMRNFLISTTGCKTNDLNCALYDGFSVYDPTMARLLCVECKKTLY